MSAASVLGARRQLEQVSFTKRIRSAPRRDLLAILPKEMWGMILQFLQWADWSSLVSLLPASLRTDPGSWSSFSTKDHACSYFHGFAAPFSKLILNRLTNIELERHRFCDEESTPHTIFPGMLYHAPSVITLRLADVFTKLEAIPFDHEFKALKHLTMSRLIHITEPGIANLLCRVPALETLCLEGHRTVPVTGDVFMPALVRSARSLKEARFFENLSAGAIDLLFTLPELEEVVLSCASMARVTFRSKEGPLTTSLKSVRFEDCSELSEDAILLLLQRNQGLESLLTHGLPLTPAIASAIHSLPNLRHLELYRCTGLTDTIAAYLAHGLFTDSDLAAFPTHMTPVPSPAPRSDPTSTSDPAPVPTPFAVPRWLTLSCHGTLLTAAGVQSLCQTTQHIQFFDLSPAMWPPASPPPIISPSALHKLVLTQTREELAFSSEDIARVAQVVSRGMEGNVAVQEIIVSGVSLDSLHPARYPTAWLDQILCLFDPTLRFSLVDFLRTVEFRYFPTKQKWQYRQLGPELPEPPAPDPDQAQPAPPPAALASHAGPQAQS